MQSCAAATIWKEKGRKKDSFNILFGRIKLSMKADANMQEKMHERGLKRAEN